MRPRVDQQNAAVGRDILGLVQDEQPAVEFLSVSSGLAGRRSVVPGGGLVSERFATPGVAGSSPLCVAGSALGA